MLMQVFLALPIILYLVQVAHQMFNRVRSRTHISSCELLPGGVVRLEFPHPKGMRACQAGQYIKVSIEAVSRLEVHPFTLSGCPEDGILQLHIKDLGDWTHRLYVLASKKDIKGRLIHAMGPFSTRSTEVANYKNLVLVGAGIGATPFTSILENMLKKNNSDGKRIHFHWIVREQQAARSWFRGLLEAIENCRCELNIMATIWYTGGMIVHSSFHRSLFELSDELFLEKTGRDIVTNVLRGNHNLSVKFGRPCWDYVLREHLKQDLTTNPLGVFCCGPSSITNALQLSCSEISSIKNPVNFRHYCKH